MKRIPVLPMLTALVALWTMAAWGQIFPGIHLQGVLTDPSGTPVEGTVSVTVQIYKQVSGGAPVYSESFNNLTISNGLLDITLGLGVGNPDSIKRALAATPTEPERWVAFLVDAGPELSPRAMLNSTPHSFRVGTVDGATGGVIFGDVSVEGSVQTIKSIAVHPSNPDMTGLVIQGASGQTANLMEIKNSDGNALFTIAPTAMLAITSSGSLQTPLMIHASPLQTSPLMEIKNSAGATLVSCASDGVIATPAIQLTDFANPRISNFPNPVPIEMKTSKGSIFIGRDDGILQQISMDPAASVSKLSEWKNGAGATVASIEPSGATTIEHELGHNLGLCHNAPVGGGFKFVECTDATGNPVASIDAVGNMSIDGDMDGLASTWESVQAIDINCNGTFNATGDVSVGGNLSIGTAVANGKLHVGGAISTAVTVVSSPTPSITLDMSHSVILCNAVLASITVNLPTAAGIAGRQYTIKLIFSNFGSVIIDPFGSQTVDGNVNHVLGAVNQYATIVSDGANWWIVANN